MSNNNSSKWLFALSSAFEYYDFIVYGLMASYLAVLFFPESETYSAQIKAFSVFALGYIVRPFGAIFWGLFGDLKGRRKAFINSNIFLGIATIGISVLPSYNQIGVAATVLLVIFRLMQAGAFAAEIPGSMSLIKEEGEGVANKFSFVIAGTSVGAIIATSAMFILENSFTKTEILNYAWRFPFVFGSLLCFVSMLLRKKLPNYAQPKKVEAHEIAGTSLPQIYNILSLLFVMAVPAFIVVMNVYFPLYIPRFYNYNSKQIFAAISFSYVVAALSPVIFSYFLWQRENNFESLTSLARIIIFSSMVTGFVLNFLLLRGGMLNLIIVLSVLQIINTSLMLLNFLTMGEVFPSKARFTLIGASYNITYLLVSFSPILVTNFSLLMQSPLAMWLIFVVLCLLALVNLNKLSPSDAAK